MKAYEIIEELRNIRRLATSPHPGGMSRARLDYSIACSKADRAIRACENVADELQRLKEAIPS